MTIWKPIPNYEMYEASDDGRVRRDGREMKQGLTFGRPVVTLCKGGYARRYTVHRLVAFASPDA